ncbi:MAG: HlyD family efflux transporter periplasmic adaptor subunit [Crocinitomicaceae bacterium]|nr:HlyD family efflux transporter periplasmic adaptor subunit [Crocinitomicaceae bacterium]
MKRSQIILLSFFLVVTGLIYMRLASNKKDYNKELKEEDKLVYVPIREVENELRTFSITSYGQITPNAEIIVSVEVQGKLQKGDVLMKPGISFRKGQILYTIDNKEAFYALSAQKSSLANIILNALPDIELDFPSERNKWIKFMEDLNPSKLLPAMPAISSSKERMFLTSRNILSQYYTLKSQEARMEKYIYLAPFNGTVISVFAEPGSIAGPGVQIAKIAKTGDYEVKVPVSMADIELYKDRSTAEFTDPSGVLIATGKIIRISDVINQQTQSADVYYSIRAIEGENIYNGMFVNVNINMESERETMVLPRVAVKDGKVRVLFNNELTTQAVLIEDSKPDSVFVTGLRNGQNVVLEQIDVSGDSTVIYNGIER